MNLVNKLSIVLMVALALTSCKKKDNDEETTPTVDECTLTTNSVVIDGNSSAIVKSNCSNPFAGTYYSEHQTDSSSTPKGVVMVFKSAATPAAGDYTINPDVLALTAGQVFVEYYEIATSWHALTGTVKVADNGSSKIYTFCKLSCSDGSTTKNVTARATCN